MISLRSAVLVSLLASCACAVPRPAVHLPDPSKGYIMVLSGEMPPPIDQVSRHSWIAVHAPGAHDFATFDLMGSGTRSDPFRYFGDGEVAVHAINEYGDDDLQEKLACLHREQACYPKEHPDYWAIPGPNSNTIIETMLRRCHIRAELPATAIGRDYRGVVGVSRTSLGTGVQLETYPAGVKVGLEEGVEVHFFDLPLGVHFFPPAITLPINPGQIGFDRSKVYVPAQTRSARFAQREEYVYDPEEHPVQVPQRSAADPEERYSLPVEPEDPLEQKARRYGVGTVTMFAKYARVIDPEAAGELRDRASVALSGRGLYGRRLGYGFGLDVEAGASLPLGFVYGAHLFPTGVGLAFGPRNSYVGLFGGFGTSGVSGHVQGALELPVELRVELDLAERVRWGARASMTWIPWSQQRDGDGLLSFTDELLLGSYVRIGRAGPCNCARALFGRGYFFGLERREIMRSAWLGASFGVEIDASN